MPLLLSRNKLWLKVISIILKTVELWIIPVLVGFDIAVIELVFRVLARCKLDCVVQQLSMALYGDTLGILMRPVLHILQFVRAVNHLPWLILQMWHWCFHSIDFVVEIFIEVISSISFIMIAICSLIVKQLMVKIIIVWLVGFFSGIEIMTRTVTSVSGRHLVMEHNVVPSELEVYHTSARWRRSFSFLCPSSTIINWNLKCYSTIKYYKGVCSGAYF